MAVKRDLQKGPASSPACSNSDSLRRSEVAHRIILVDRDQELAPFLRRESRRLVSEGDDGRRG